MRPGFSPTPSWLPAPSARRFPQIGEIDGVRPDSKPWHPSGLAIDIMIPNPESPEGIALGDEISRSRWQMRAGSGYRM